MTTVPVRIAIALALCIACVNAAAVNLLSNSGFATNTAGWSLEQPANSTLAWNPVDANGAAGSGSALVTNTTDGPGNGTGIVQCVTGISDGATYTYGGKVLFPTGQATTGSMEIGPRWHAGANCTGSVLG